MPIDAVSAMYETGVLVENPSLIAKLFRKRMGYVDPDPIGSAASEVNPGLVTAALQGRSRNQKPIVNGGFDGHPPGQDSDTLMWQENAMNPPAPPNPMGQSLTESTWHNAVNEYGGNSGTIQMMVNRYTQILPISNDNKSQVLNNAWTRENRKKAGLNPFSNTYAANSRGLMEPGASLSKKELGRMIEGRSKRPKGPRREGPSLPPPPPKGGGSSGSDQFMSNHARAWQNRGVPAGVAGRRATDARTRTTREVLRGMGLYGKDNPDTRMSRSIGEEGSVTGQSGVAWNGAASAHYSTTSSLSGFSDDGSFDDLSSLDGYAQAGVNIRSRQYHASQMAAKVSSAMNSVASSRSSMNQSVASNAETSFVPATSRPGVTRPVVSLREQTIRARASQRAMERKILITNTRGRGAAVGTAPGVMLSARVTEENEGFAMDMQETGAMGTKRMVSADDASLDTRRESRSRHKKDSSISIPPAHYPPVPVPQRRDILNAANAQHMERYFSRHRVEKLS